MTATRKGMSWGDTHDGDMGRNGVLPPIGSYGVVRTSGLLGALIRVGTRSQVNHAFVMIDNYGNCVEARLTGAKVRHISEYHGHLVVFNDEEPLTVKQRAAISIEAKHLVGTPYHLLDLLVLALVCLGIRWRWAADRVERMDRLICSQLVDRAYLRGGVHLFNDGRLSGQVTPGDLLLRCASNAWSCM